MEAEIVSAIIAIVGSIAGATIYWQRFKTKLSQVRQLIEVVDDALYDNKVTEKEYQAIWEAVKRLLKVEEK